MRLSGFVWRRRTHVALQQVEHALLCDLFALVELLQRLFDLLLLDLPMTLLLVVEVQAAALHLLQVVLQDTEEALESGSAAPPRTPAGSSPVSL